MKKILFLILLFIIGINNVTASTNTAYSYVLMDMNSGRVLKSKNKDAKLLIASISNVMTT